jgi:hypothetical protein
MNCCKYRDAEKLIALALSGEPPLEIAEELRNLLENVNFLRHLELKGIELSDNDVQLVIAGNEVGYGYAKTKEVTSRIKTFQDLALRTGERISGRPYRNNGPIAAEHKIFCNSYMSSFRAASMAFTIKFGNPGEPTLPGFGNYEQIIDDITENISLIDEDKIDILKERIVDKAYFDNFLASAKELAPDGDAVKLFGITTVKQGLERKTVLTSKREKLSEIIRNVNCNSENDPNNLTGNDTNQTVTGTLKVANAKTNSVEIISDDKKTTVKLTVPDGLSDIVKKYWDESVCVEYFRKNKKLYLVNIEGQID